MTSRATLTETRHQEYLDDVRDAYTRPLTLAETRAVRAETARGCPAAEAERRVREMAAYWAGSIGASVGRDVRAGRVRTIHAGPSVASVLKRATRVAPILP